VSDINTKKKGKLEKCFFGCNTAYGFHSFYDFFTELDGAKISIIKGGPGTGKSTFIKSIAEAMIEKGYDVELQLCSLDCNSLDALVVPAIKVALVAGTGHHVLDPKHPGAVDGIINLGSYWDERGISVYRQDIVAINKEIDRRFRKVYRYLKSAKLIRDNIEEINSNAQSFSRLNRITEDLIVEISKGREVADVIGKERHLFASSITTEGYICYIDTMINDDTKIYVIVGDYGTGKSTMLKRIAEMAGVRGLSVEYYHCPLDPEKIEHLKLPEMNILITTENLIARDNCLAVYNLDEYLNGEDVSNYEVLNEKGKYEGMIQEAIQNLHEAKKLHAELEKYYISNMDFEAINECRERTLQKILAYADHVSPLG
jgi:hypothetical protein